MSRISLIRPRRHRAVWDRPATDTRLLPNPFPLGHRMFPLILRFSKGRVEAHALPKTVSLVPSSGDGRSIDSTRQALLLGNHCRDYAPLTGRVYVAAIDLAGESVQPAIGGIRAIEPSHDSTVITICELRFNDDGLGSMFPFLKVVEHHWWTGKPHTEIFSTFVHILKNVWGCRRVVVDATGIGAGVDAFLRKSPRPSIACSFPPSFQTLYSVIPDSHPAKRTPRRESISKGGAAHPEALEGSSGGRPAPIPHSTLIHRDLPHSLSFRGSSQNVRLWWEESRTCPLALLPHLPPKKGPVNQPTPHHPQPNGKRKHPSFQTIKVRA